MKKLLASISLHLPPGVDLILARSGLQLHVAIEVGFDALFRSPTKLHYVGILCILLLFNLALYYTMLRHFLDYACVNNNL